MYGELGVPRWPIVNCGKDVAIVNVLCFLIPSSGDYRNVGTGLALATDVSLVLSLNWKLVVHLHWLVVYVVKYASRGWVHLEHIDSHI